MFPKSSVFAVVALAAFVSLGALLFPQVGQAQDCLFDCPDLGSDPSFNPWGNSPQALDIAYCFDRDCVLNLKVGNKPIFSGNSIPTPHVTHNPVTTFSCPGTFDVKISGTVVALLRDPATGNLIPGTQARASLNIVVKGVTCSTPGNDQILSKILILDPHIPAGQPRTDVFDAMSKITIGLGDPIGIGPGIPSGVGWEAGGCSTGSAASCAFPLGIVEFQNNHALGLELPATASVPQVNSFQVGEVYRAVKSTKFVGVRDCKGDANGLLSTIACSVGGGEAEGLFTFQGNWSGAGTKTINPKSGTGPYDIITPLFGSILPETVTASANNGPEVPNRGCNDMPSQGVERCFFSANDLLPNGCTPNQPVAILVRGKLDTGGMEFGFVSRDTPTCNTK
jgi:hypothetical protein